MKIAYVCYNPYPGNAPFFVHTQKLAESGCDVVAFALKRPGEPPSERLGDVQVERIAPYEPEASQKTTIPRFLLQAKRALDSHETFDIVHATNLIGISLLPILSRRQATGWVFEIRSPPLYGAWRAAISNLRTRAESSAFDLTLVHAQAVGMAIFSDNRQFEEVPIGVDLEHFALGRNVQLRSELGLSDDDLVALYVGTISKQRSLWNMLEAFAKAADQVSHLHLLVLGWPEHAWLTEMQPHIHELGLADKVHYCGYHPYSDMPQYFQAADIGLGFVPITPWYDKAPVLKTMEYLAAGLPVVATATEGNALYITHEENGLLVGDTPEAFAAGIVKVATDSSLRNRFKGAARESIRPYSWQTIVSDKLLPAYERALAKKRHPSDLLSKGDR